MTLWVDAHLSPAIATWITSTFGITVLALCDVGLGDVEDPMNLSGDVECDQVYVTAGHKGNPKPSEKKALMSVQPRGKKRWSHPAALLPSQRGSGRGTLEKDSAANFRHYGPRWRSGDSEA